MEQRRLGNSGLYVSAVGIGCNNFFAAERSAVAGILED